VPLSFPSRDLYGEFRGELREALMTSHVTDATVQVVGSAMYGWNANPRKPLRAWTIASDVDLAVFSAQALVQARNLGVPVNMEVILDNEYVILRNMVPGNRGFYDTPLGENLRRLARRWNERLYPDVEDAEGIDFKLNLRLKPFPTAITVISAEEVP
jgi:hypothetical protein